MNVYLAIITTALVITQIIRTTQNAIELRRQKKQFDKTIGWFNDNDISEKDFEVQREVFYELLDWLKAQKGDDTVHCYECSHWQKWKSFSEYPERKWCDAQGYYTHPSGTCPRGEAKDE